MFCLHVCKGTACMPGYHVSIMGGCELPHRYWLSHTILVTIYFLIKKPINSLIQSIKKHVKYFHVLAHAGYRGDKTDVVSTGLPSPLLFETGPYYGTLAVLNSWHGPDWSGTHRAPCAQTTWVLELKAGYTSSCFPFTCRAPGLFCYTWKPQP